MYPMCKGEHAWRAGLSDAKLCLRADFTWRAWLLPLPRVIRSAVPEAAPTERVICGAFWLFHLAGPDPVPSLEHQADRVPSQDRSACNLHNSDPAGGAQHVLLSIFRRPPF